MITKKDSPFPAHPLQKRQYHSALLATFRRMAVFSLFCLIGFSSSVFADADFEIDGAKYKAEKDRFEVKGKAQDDAIVNLFDAENNVLIATLQADDEGDWEYRKKHPSSIPCRVRAESDGESDNKSAEHADEFPGGCGIGGGGSNIAPTANANGPYAGITGATISFSSVGSADDDGAIVTYAWDFGDGQTSTSANPGHAYSAAGTYTVSLVVTDNEGASDTDSSIVVITDPGQPANVSINSTSQNVIPGPPVPEQALAGNTDYRLFGTNDLGMHCGDFDARISSILPPFNILHAQVIQRGKDPKILDPNDGVSVVYSAASNPGDPVLTGIDSAGNGPVLSGLANDGTAFKTNFWNIVNGGSESIALAAYRAFYPPGVLEAFIPNVDQSLPAPNVERLYLGDGVLTAEQQSMPGRAAPTLENTPQNFHLFTIDQPFFLNFPFGYTARDVNWYEAAGVPLTAFDDAGRENPWPLYRFQAKDSSGNTLASTDVVLPISGEANCGECHNAPIDGGNGAATHMLDNIATVFDDPEFDVSTPMVVSLEYAADLNLVRLHDQKHATNLENSTPVVCQSCHYTPALDLAQVGPKGASDADSNGRLQTNVRSMSSVMHKHHATVTDIGGNLLFPSMPPPVDANGNPRDPLAAREVLQNTCYQCHPGRRTDCLRGAMADGGMLCQDCHGDMEQVGNDFTKFVSPDNPGAFHLANDFYTNPDTLRVPWANEPGCGSCHTGDANDNLRGKPGTLGAPNDLIRLVQAYLTTDPKATPIVPTNKRFAENVVASADPGAAGNPMLYRVSSGHEGVMCEACHGATHGIWPNKNPLANDNVTAMQLQGHTGTISECSTCHTGDMGANLGGPHGMHPIGTAGKKFAEGDHAKLVEKNADDCRACHGQNGEGTVLSTMAQERVLKCDDSTNFCPNGDSVSFPNDYQVGCTECHDNEL